MNYIRHLNSFFEKASADTELNPTHISLYLSLFQHWNFARFQNPISIARADAMRMSKIYAKATYHKCIRELHQLGYILYKPSRNPYRGSLVEMIHFVNGNAKDESENPKPKKNNERKKAKTNTSSQSDEHDYSHVQDMFNDPPLSVPKNEQALVPYINKYINSKQTNVSARKKSINKKSKDSTKVQYGLFKPPALTEVTEYFTSLAEPPQEAEKFFNHYCSNGWLVGGKASMVNWKASARNWILNAKHFANENSGKKRPKPGQLHSVGNKNYSEPL